MVSWILYTLLSGTVVAGAAALVAFALPPGVGRRRWVWAGAITLALFLALPWRPSLSLPGGTANLAGVVVGALAPLSGMAGVGPGELGADGGPFWGPAWKAVWNLSGFSLSGVLLLGWVAGSLLLLGRRARQHLRTHRVLAHARPRKVDGVPVRFVDTTGPGVIGIWRPQIVVPSWVQELPFQERRWILRHEVEHVAARDPLLVEAATLIAILFPWNLPLWYLRRRLIAAVELDCDARVLMGAQEGEDERTYGHLLITVASRGAPTGLALAGRASRILTRRIAMIANPTHPPAIRRGVALALGMGLLLAAACMEPGSGSDPLEVTALDETSEAVDAGVLDPGPQRADGLDQEPDFTPFHQAPEVLNRDHVAELLEAAYPEEFRDAGIGGTAVVHIFVDEEGQPGRVLLAEPSGAEALDAAARSVARAFQFSPARLEGEVVPVWIQIPITFTSEQDP